MCRWKRAYFEAEHTRRKEKRKWKRAEAEHMRTISDQRETLMLMEAEVRRTRRELRSRMRIIREMHATLAQHNLPTRHHTIESLRICAAENDEEMCPLSLNPINSEVDVLDPLHPNHKCAQLQCGHRFNGVWLMRHFVRNQTFRCPLCRAGSSRFNFDPASIPQCLLSPNDANSVRRS